MRSALVLLALCAVFIAADAMTATKQNLRGNMYPKGTTGLPNPKDENAFDAAVLKHITKTYDITKTKKKVEVKAKPVSIAEYSTANLRAWVSGGCKLKRKQKFPNISAFSSQRIIRILKNENAKGRKLSKAEINSCLGVKSSNVNNDYLKKVDLILSVNKFAPVSYVKPAKNNDI